MDPDLNIIDVAELKIRWKSSTKVKLKTNSVKMIDRANFWLNQLNYEKKCQ